VANITENAQDLLNKRYLRKKYNEKTWKDICYRVSKAIADAEETDELKQYWFTIFLNLMFPMDFISSTPVLLNADVNNPGQLSSCFIIDVRDNMESIYQAKTECAKIFQKNGGVGFNISALRPENSTVETSKGYSCGPLGFMEEFNLTADIVTRNNVRKGAMKIDLNSWHPDIYKFIHCKDDTTKFTFMNISVSLCDKFMNAVDNDLEWDLKFPDYSWNKEIYNQKWNGNIEEWESKGYPVKIYETIKAKDLYKEIMQSAWKTGEPGVSFRDNMDKANPNPHLGHITGSNPCQEFTNIPYSSCNLGSLNLSNYGTTKTEVFERIKEIVPKAVRFLDDMITVNKLPLEKIEQVTKDIRPIGLGTFGLADLLYKLKIPYNSKEGYKFVDELYDLIQIEAECTSINLAKEKGVYPKFNGSVWDKQGQVMRNSALISIAPTGSISFLANTSGGLEPNYALVMQRRTNEGDLYYIVNQVFEKWLKDNDLYSQELLDKVWNNNGSVKGLKEIPEDVQKVFVTTYDITPDEHLKVLSIIQSHVDLSASKTINLSSDCKVEEIMNLYLNAWKQGIKGVTVYRSGCRDNQVLSTGSTSSVPENNQTEEKQEIKQELRFPDALSEVYGVYRKFKIGCGSMRLFLGVNSEGDLIEIRTETSGGGCQANIESLSRFVSKNLGMYVVHDDICDQLKSAYCKNSFDKIGCRSCGHVIAKAIEEFDKQDINIIQISKNKNKKIEQVAKSSIPTVEQYEKSLEKLTQHLVSKDIVCPECNEKTVFGENCVKCTNCGWSKC
jgi:ribonucleoside-diphosphate reductase alpha chain